MKLVFLSMCGKLDEPEETKYINLYLASLKKYVVPFFETKVILFTTYKIDNIHDNLIVKRIKEFDLQDIVVLKTLETIDLPQKSIDLIKDVNWFNRIGIHMNVLFDYAKRNNFFDADWIFHADTDSEFLENFQVCMNSLNEAKQVDNRVLITLSGDAFPVHMVCNNYQYVFDEPERINFYDEQNVKPQTTEITVKKNEIGINDHRRDSKKAYFAPAQMKVRNDFVGMSRQAAESANFNWVFAYYPYDFKDNGPVKDFWPDKAIKIDENGNEEEVPMPQIHINYHMGGMLQYKLHSNEVYMTRIQLPGYQYMMLHHSSGWFQNHFMDRCMESLNTKFKDTKHIWESDYLTKEQIQDKIVKLQEELKNLKRIQELM